jgi:hypothetical protein
MVLKLDLLLLKEEHRVKVCEDEEVSRCNRRTQEVSQRGTV